MAKIEIYSTPTCPYCLMAKNFFKENNLDYTDYDVSKDQDKAQEMIDKTGQMGVPVIVIDEKIMVGFDQGAVMKALNL